MKKVLLCILIVLLLVPHANASSVITDELQETEIGQVKYGETYNKTFTLNATDTTNTIVTIDLPFGKIPVWGAEFSWQTDLANYELFFHLKFLKELPLSSAISQYWKNQ